MRRGRTGHGTALVSPGVRKKLNSVDRGEGTEDSFEGPSDLDYMIRQVSEQVWKT